MGAVSDLKSKKRLLAQKKIHQFLKNQDRKKLSNKALSYFRLFDYQSHRRKNRVIALYSPLKTEVRPESLKKFFPQSCFVYPIEGGCFMEGASFKKSKRGFLQPEGGRKISPRNIDLFILPLLAFDRRLNRLGRGAGFYDRVFSSAKKKAVKIGLSWSIQVQNTLLPQEPHDRSLDAVLTESWALLSPQLFKKNSFFQTKRGRHV